MRPDSLGQTTIGVIFPYMPIAYWSKNRVKKRNCTYIFKDSLYLHTVNAVDVKTLGAAERDKRAR
jgi:hypothetical protein